jgi:phosphate transport system substrate-binding protein
MTHLPLRRITRQAAATSIAALALSLTACGGGTPQAGTSPAGESPAATGASPTAEASATVKVDGSSTVFPISEAMAEEFMKSNPNIKVIVGTSGTGGGFKKFCAGETDISNASRPIKTEEIELCKKGNVEYVELPISYDGLSVVVNPKNDFVTCLSVDQLKKMWEPAAEGKVKNWKDIDPKFPDKPLTLYGAGTDSGTYDYFTKAITGEEGKSRGDYTPSEDDNVIVQGVSGDEGSLGFFGFAYYEANQDKLKLVEIKNKSGKCVAPSAETIADGSYSPLSRPEFIYVKKDALNRPEVKAFVAFQIDPANKKLISDTGYLPLPEDVIALAKERLDKGTTGSVFGGKPPVGAKLADLLKAEQAGGKASPEKK